jgi:acetyl esterase/lipase
MSAPATSAIALVRLAAATVAAGLGAVVRRLTRGPMVSSWSWAVEIRVFALRGLIRASFDDSVAPHALRLQARLNPPVPRRLRGVLRVEKATLGGRPGEWILRHGRGALVDRATILYLHGGAYLAGSPATHRHFTSRLTWVAHSRTYVPAYRLAPDHLFPAAVDDAEAVYRALLDGGTDPARVILSGDSAGGGLACALLLRIRDRGLPPPAGAVLFSPYTDLEHQGASFIGNAATDYIPIVGEIRPNLEYLGTADPRDPFASPLYGDFTGAPPLLVFAGGKEMVLDDSVRLADKARSNGVDVQLHIEPDMFHVWPAVVPDHPASLRALAHVSEWIAARTA